MMSLYIYVIIRHIHINGIQTFIPVWLTPIYDESSLLTAICVRDALALYFPRHSLQYISLYSVGV